MGELLSIAKEIRDLLVMLNDKMDNIGGFGAYSISDIIDEISGIKGGLGWDLSDIYNKQTEIFDAIDGIKGLWNLDDIYNLIEGK